MAAWHLLCEGCGSVRKPFFLIPVNALLTCLPRPQTDLFTPCILVAPCRPALQKERCVREAPFWRRQLGANCVCDCPRGNGGACGMLTRAWRDWMKIGELVLWRPCGCMRVGTVVSCRAEFICLMPSRPAQAHWNWCSEMAKQARYVLVKL